MKKIVSIIAIILLIGCTKETSIEQPKKDTIATIKLPLKYKR